jgi:hypothetical protein
MFSVGRKLSTIERRYQSQSCLFQRGDTGTQVTNPKTVRGSSPGVDVGFRDNNNCFLRYSSIRIE